MMAASHSELLSTCLVVVGGSYFIHLRGRRLHSCRKPGRMHIQPVKRSNLGVVIGSMDAFLAMLPQVSFLHGRSVA